MKKEFSFSVPISVLSVFSVVTIPLQVLQVLRGEIDPRCHPVRPWDSIESNSLAVENACRGGRGALEGAAASARRRPRRAALQAIRRVPVGSEWDPRRQVSFRYARPQPGARLNPEPWFSYQRLGYSPRCRRKKASERWPPQPCSPAKKSNSRLSSAAATS